MYCPNCGSQVGDSKFCPKCGENLKAAVPSQTPAETPVEEIKPTEKVETSQTEPIPTPPEPDTREPISPPPETPKPKPINKPPEPKTPEEPEHINKPPEPEIPKEPEHINKPPEPETPEEPEHITDLKTPEAAPSTTSQATYSLNEFASKTLQKDIGLQTFELENKYLLDVNLDGKVWGKLGSMVAYTGNVRFKRQSSLEQGIDKFVKKTLTGESIHIMKIKGQGHVYLADMGKQITLINLQNEKMYVNGNNILAFEEGIDWDIKMMTSGSSMMTGGLFNIKLKGTGMVAITTHYTPLTIRVTPDAPVMTDPHATVAWSSGLSTSVKMDVDFKTLLGKDSQETIQMKFKGDGFIIVQPYEE